MKKVTVIGGGTGAYVVLSGLKNEKIDLAAIVNMTDSGGSTGRLRDQLGVLPPGDLRQCLLALSEAPDLWRRLFLYRFESGDFTGHNFGNIFLSALEKVTDSYSEVIETVSYVLNIKGQVIPVTYEKTHLCAEYEDGRIIKGEAEIDDNSKQRSKIKKAYLEPNVEANPKALDRLAETDFLIVCPGDLYTSIVPVLLAKGASTIIQRSSLRILYIMNLMTKRGQTTHYSAKDHLKDLTLYLKRSPDWIIINNGRVPESALNWYHEFEETPVINDLEQTSDTKIIQKDVIDRSTPVKDQADKLTRSILRHNPKELSQIIMKLVRNL